MSLSLWDSMWDSLIIHPSNLWNQYLGGGMGPNEVLAPSIRREFRPFYRPHLQRYHSRPCWSDARGSVNFDHDRFQACLDVQQFKPEEISVKVVADENVITVEGKHEERPDEHGYVSRHFMRRYILPQGHDINKIESKLSSDGVLTITAPKVACGDSLQTRSIPIKKTF